MRTGRRYDFTFYLRALPLYLRNPAILAAPLLGSVVNLVLRYISVPATDPVGGAGSSLFGIIAQLITGFCLGVAVIVADDAWRHGRANFESDWNDARRKAGNILIAALGFFFVLYVAGLVGSLVGILGGIFAIALNALAFFGLIYTIPAAAIGGVPGFAALSASVRLARSMPWQTIILAAISFVVLNYVGGWILSAFLPYLAEPWSSLVTALIVAILYGYLATVAAKQYADLSFSRFW